jgi:hypothetical protein
MDPVDLEVQLDHQQHLEYPVRQMDPEHPVVLVRLEDPMDPVDQAASYWIEVLLVLLTFIIFVHMSSSFLI